MSAKETIFVAVLMNAGLLILLFASALKPSTPWPQNNHENTTLSSKETVVPVSEIKSFSAPLSQASSPSAVSASNTLAAPLILSSADQMPAEAISPPLSAAILPQALQPLPPLLPPPQAQPSSLTTFTNITVKKGDALEKLAKRYHTSVEEIMTHNHLTTTSLKIGQVLKIPSSSPPTPVADSLAETEKEGWYTLKSGDTPWLVAIKHRMKVEELLKINDLDEEKARKLKPGDQIRIR